jgi:hypothetical protein
MAGGWNAPVSKVVLSPAALHRLKGSPPSTLVWRGVCLHVLWSTLHQGLPVSPPGSAHVLPKVYVSPVLTEV